mmetsp:Transcript_67308/g.173306  ORF Transcript_67308/g.173306 Transcript_67308/m.173306 type:complete len:146 (-) Transcript_67308:44-481(-)
MGAVPSAPCCGSGQCDKDKLMDVTDIVTVMATHPITGAGLKNTDLLPLNVEHEHTIPEIFSVRIERPTPTVPLGLDVYRETSQLLRVEVILEVGLLAKWNAENPELSVQAGDRILAVNGISGDSGRMLYQCSHEDCLTLVIQRPS